jgi:hypothetical protein
LGRTASLAGDAGKAGFQARGALRALRAGPPGNRRGLPFGTGAQKNRRYRDSKLNLNLGYVGSKAVLRFVASEGQQQAAENPSSQMRTYHGGKRCRAN